MEAKLLEQILQELRDIRADLSWFKEREERPRCEVLSR